MLEQGYLKESLKSKTLNLFQGKVQNDTFGGPHITLKHSTIYDTVSPGRNVKVEQVWVDFLLGNMQR
jgi:hypothetical protein